MRALAKEVGLITAFKLAQYPDIENELLRIDEVLLKFEGSRHDHLFRRWSQSVCEYIRVHTGRWWWLVLNHL